MLADDDGSVGTMDCSVEDKRMLNTAGDTAAVEAITDDGLNENSDCDEAFGYDFSDMYAADSQHHEGLDTCIIDIKKITNNLLERHLETERRTQTPQDTQYEQNQVVKPEINREDKNNLVNVDEPLKSELSNISGSSMDSKSRSGEHLTVCGNDAVKRPRIILKLKTVTEENPKRRRRKATDPKRVVQSSLSENYTDEHNTNNSDSNLPCIEVSEEMDDDFTDNHANGIEEDDDFTDNHANGIEEDDDFTDNHANGIEEDDDFTDNHANGIEEDDDFTDNHANGIEEDDDFTDNYANGIEEDDDFTDNHANGIEKEELDRSEFKHMLYNNFPQASAEMAHELALGEENKSKTSKKSKKKPRPHGIELPEPVPVESANGEEPVLMFPCKICSKNCQNKASYISHVKACSFLNSIPSTFQNGKHECSICSKAYVLRTSLARHMKIHLGLVDCKCPFCDKQFSDEHSLKGHILIHTGEKPFTCKFCGLKFRDKSTLRKHERASKHGTERPFHCDICSKDFFMKTDLRKHQKIHMEDKEFKCDKCNKQFYLKTTLKRHQQVHTGERPCKCQICGKFYADPNSLKNHHRKHAGEKPLKSEKDPFDATSVWKSREKTHLNVRSDDGSSQCDTTEQNKTVSKIKLDGNHAAEHRTDQTETCAENDLEQNSIDGSLMDSHTDDPERKILEVFKVGAGDLHSMITEHNQDEIQKVEEEKEDIKPKRKKLKISLLKITSAKPETTNVTPKTTNVTVKRTNVTPKPHGINIPGPVLVDSVNGDKPVYMLECERCKKMCKNKASYISHYKACSFVTFSVDSFVDGKHKCEICGKSYELRIRLQRHMKLHLGLIEFKCEICGKELADAQSLRGHILIHTGEKPFTCRFCGFKSRDKSTLRRHETRHGTVKPFHCDICSKDFFLRVDLTKHRKIHSDDKEFKCDQCSKQFVLKTQLKRHYQVHTGDRPFECQFCSKFFADKTSLTIHYTTHTGIKPFKCHMCDAAFTIKYRLELHIKRHNNDRPFECDVCGHKFLQKSDLKCHQKLHTGERDHICPTCGKSFCDSGGLWKHKRLHTKSHECSFCSRMYASEYICKRHQITCKRKKAIENGTDEVGEETIKVDKISMNKVAGIFEDNQMLATASASKELMDDIVDRYINSSSSLIGRKHFDVINNKRTEILINEPPEIPLNFLTEFRT